MKFEFIQLSKKQDSNYFEEKINGNGKHEMYVNADMFLYLGKNTCKNFYARNSYILFALI